MKTATAKRAFTLIEIMIVLLIIGIVLGIAVPAWLHARTTGRAKACHENQTQLMGAVDRWAIEHNKATGEAGPDLSELVGNESFLRKTPICPAGLVPYAVPAVGASAVCPNLATSPDHALP